MDNDLISRTSAKNAIALEYIALTSKAKTKAASDRASRQLHREIDAINRIPAIDPDGLRPSGRWVPIHETRIVNGHPLFADGYECSVCHKGHSGMEYCERCGAKNGTTGNGGGTDNGQYKRICFR